MSVYLLQVNQIGLDIDDLGFTRTSELSCEAIGLTSVQNVLPKLETVPTCASELSISKAVTPFPYVVVQPPKRYRSNQRSNIC